MDCFFFKFQGLPDLGSYLPLEQRFKKNSFSFSEFTVFAKKEIPLRTKFGPFLGDVKNMSEDEWNSLKREINLATVYPILIIDGFRILETSNESKSQITHFI